jgi:hypothetical protein
LPIRGFPGQDEIAGEQRRLLKSAAPDFADVLWTTGYWRALNRSDRSSAESESCRGEGAAVESSVAASGRPEQILQNSRAILRQSRQAQPAAGLRFG